MQATRQHQQLCLLSLFYFPSTLETTTISLLSHDSPASSILRPGRKTSGCRLPPRARLLWRPSGASPIVHRRRSRRLQQRDRQPYVHLPLHAVAERTSAIQASLQSHEEALRWIKDCGEEASAALHWIAVACRGVGWLTSRAWNPGELDPYLAGVHVWSR
jgi:hypothetical protein